MDDIGKNLKKLRIQKQFSLRGLANAAHISHSFIADIEAGRSRPSIETLEELTKALGVPIFEIMGNGQLNVAEKEDSTVAAHRTDDPMADLPEEARKSVEEFMEYIRRKYGKDHSKE